MPGGEAENPVEEVTKVAATVGISLSKADITISESWPRPVVAEYVQQETKAVIMANSRELELEEGSTEPVNFVNDDITGLPAKVLRAFEDKPGVKGVTSVEKKLRSWLTFKNCFSTTYTKQKSGIHRFSLLLVILQVGLYVSA